MKYKTLYGLLALSLLTLPCKEVKGEKRKFIDVSQEETETENHNRATPHGKKRLPYRGHPSGTCKLSSARSKKEGVFTWNNIGPSDDSLQGNEKPDEKKESPSQHIEFIHHPINSVDENRMEIPKKYNKTLEKELAKEKLYSEGLEAALEVREQITPL